MSVLFNNPNWPIALASLMVEIALCLVLILLARLLFRRVIDPVGCRLLWAVLIVRCLIPVSIPTQYHPVTLLLSAYQQSESKSSTASIARNSSRERSAAQ